MNPIALLADEGERGRLLARLSQDPTAAARALIGCVLLRRRGRVLQAARIVETEAYLGTGDPAAHASAGRTARTAPLWGPPGTLYVYFVYGMHHSFNVAVDREASPGCVLVRAAEPLHETATAEPEPSLEARACCGPGRLCRALGIDTRLSGRHLFEPHWELTLREGREAARIGVAPRVGITRAAEWLLRFYDADSAAISAPRPSGVSCPAIPRGTAPRPAVVSRRGRR